MPLFVPKDRKSLFRQFLAGMYDAVVITDPNGHIIEINPRAEEHFGYSQDEVIDRPISFFIPGLAPEIVQRIRRGLENDRHMMLDAKGRCKSDDKFACEVEPEDMPAGLNHIVFMNASPNLGDNKAYYFGFDAIILEPIRPTDATFLLVR